VAQNRVLNSTFSSLSAERVVARYGPDVSPAVRAAAGGPFTVTVGRNFDRPRTRDRERERDSAMAPPITGISSFEFCLTNSEELAVAIAEETLPVSKLSLSNSSHRFRSPVGIISEQCIMKNLVPVETQKPPTFSFE